jgi:hypothetical protein
MSSEIGNLTEMVELLTSCTSDGASFLIRLPPASRRSPHFGPSVAPPPPQYGAPLSDRVRYRILGIGFCAGNIRTSTLARS